MTATFIGSTIKVSRQWSVEIQFSDERHSSLAENENAAVSSRELTARDEHEASTDDAHARQVAVGSFLIEERVSSDSMVLYF